MTAVEGGRASQNLGGRLPRDADCPQSAARGQPNPLEKFVLSGLTQSLRVGTTHSLFLRRCRINEGVRSAPTGLRHPAQGWSAATTLGTGTKIMIYPERVAAVLQNGDATPFGLKIILTHDPG